MWTVWSAKMARVNESELGKERRLWSWTLLLWQEIPFCFEIGCPCWHWRVYGLALPQLFLSLAIIRTFRTRFFSQGPLFPPTAAVSIAQVPTLPSNFWTSAKFIAISSPFPWLASALLRLRCSWIIKKVLVLFCQARLNLAEVQTLWRIFAFFRDFIFESAPGLFPFLCLLFNELNDPFCRLKRVIIELHFPLFGKIQ